MFERSYNDTMCFLKPLIDAKHELSADFGLINLYAGNVLRNHHFGEYLVAHVVQGSYAHKVLLEHPWKSFVDLVEDGTVAISLKPTPRVYNRIIKPFVEGKFSQIDREYVNEHFKREKSDGSLSRNWLILTKDPYLKQLIEDYINPTGNRLAYVHIPDHAELASKPDAAREMCYL